MLRGFPAHRRLVALWLCPVLLSCSAAPRALPSDADGFSGPSGPWDLARFVLVIREAPEGHPVHEWRPVSGFDVSEYLSERPFAEERERTARAEASGKLRLAAFNRNCEEEQATCERNCRNSFKGSDWSHVRTPRARRDVCSERCLKPYVDCCRLRELESKEFRSIHEAVDGLKRYRTEILVGTSVVIAGVVFVVVVAGTGGAALILVPAVLVASPQIPREHHLAEARP